MSRGGLAIVSAVHSCPPQNQYTPNPHPQNPPKRYEVLDRLVQGLSSLFLSLRRRPVIRYQRGSDAAQRLAESLYGLTYKQQVAVFDFGSHRTSPVVLLLDRRDDPVTPLLTQWTYQAMIHELLGINDGTVVLDTPKVPAEYR